MGLMKAMETQGRRRRKRGKVSLSISPTDPAEFESRKQITGSLRLAGCSETGFPQGGRSQQVARSAPLGGGVAVRETVID